MINERSYPDINQACLVLAEKLASSISTAIYDRGKALIALSGGRTPKTVFEYLQNFDIEWGKVTITLTDERWVDPEDSQSNENLVRIYLLTGKAKSATFVSLYGGEGTPKEGEVDCEARLKKLQLPFDAIYLGLGPDGHFASLFPSDQALDRTESICVAVQEAKFGIPRMSLTKTAILNSKKIYLLFSGEDKHSIYRQAKKEGPYKEIPLRLILLQNQTPVTVISAP
ncbi:6-phosphogluconolactonase [Calditrichota bacterium]